MKNLILYLFFLLILSCKQEDRIYDLSNSQKIYFDLGKYVKQDIANNSKLNCSEEKMVLINHKKETHKLDSINWENELQLIMNCDINKPNWIGKFDSLVFDDGKKRTYIANTSKIPIRKMTVHYENDKVISVIIEKKISTLLFSNLQQITYFPGKSFKIEAKQSAFFMKDFNSEVEIKYLCNQ